MWMLSVTIPWDRTTARVKIDFVEMEPNAQVTFCNISFYLFSPYFSGRYSTRPKLAQECNVPNFCTVFYRQQAQKYEPISIRDITRWVVRNKLDTFGFSQLMLHVWLYNKETIGRSIIQVWVWPQDSTVASLSKRHWHPGNSPDSRRVLLAFEVISPACSAHWRSRESVMLMS